jgi:hypothetical protein
VTPCSWCGHEIPPKRRGRPGKRRFCQPKCKRAWQDAGREIGAATLVRLGGTGENALKQWRANS